MKYAIGIISGAGLLLSVVLANWLTSTYGFVPVGLGLASTAGTFAFGFALALRDAAQDALGRWPMLAIVATGAVVSYFVADPTIAIASAVAFAVAELANFAVYTPLRNRSKLGDLRWTAAVTSSSIVGALVDTILFLVIAFGAASVTLLVVLGQLLGKAYATVLYLLVGKIAARFAPR